MLVEAVVFVHHTPVKSRFASIAKAYPRVESLLFKVFFPLALGAIKLECLAGKVFSGQSYSCEIGALPIQSQKLDLPIKFVRTCSLANSSFSAKIFLLVSEL
jgi:hypothetical protein